MWKEGIELVTELAVDSKCRRSSSAFIEINIHLNPKRCEREGRHIDECFDRIHRLAMSLL